MTTKNLICELRKRRFKVKAVVSDMAGSNQAMWRADGVASSRQVFAIGVR